MMRAPESFFSDRRVFLVETGQLTYDIPWPFNPDRAYPELKSLPFCRSDSAPNPIYEGVRAILLMMELDQENRETGRWNPLSHYVRPGATIVIKPNFVRHCNENPEEPLDAVITHPSVLRPLIDFSFLAVGKQGKVLIAEAAHSDCDIDKVKQIHRIRDLERLYAEAGFHLKFIDTRKEQVVMKEGVILKQQPLPGDPKGYTIAKVNQNSEFEDEAVSPSLLRGVDYEYSETSLHHERGVHEYCISKTIMDADLVINVPKIKTHYKIGLTAALKNLVGINGDKNWLPHWRKGMTDEGGDQFMQRTRFNRFKSDFIHVIAPYMRYRPVSLLAYAGACGLHLLGLRNNFGCGSWYGNDTIWRTTLDLNKVLFYYGSDGETSGKLYTRRGYLTICDGIICGESKGPLAPKSKPLGILVGARNPAYCDLVIARLMGFDYKKVRFLQKLFEVRTLPLIDVVAMDDLQLCHLDALDVERTYEYSAIPINYNFEAAPNWKGYIELSARPEMASIVHEK